MRLEGYVNPMMNPKTSHKTSKKRWIFSILFFLIFLVFIQLGNMAFQIVLLHNKNPQTTAFIQYYLKHCPNASECPFEQSWKPFSDISENVKEAILIGEDDAFFEHDGIDAEAIRESIEKNMKKKKFVRGGSTITQQLVKNLYLSPSKNPFRKIKEIIMALFMEKILTKNRILEIYLNVIEWGHGIYGIEAAAQHYFLKTSNKLTNEEAAFLAAIVPNPVFYTSPAGQKRLRFRKNLLFKRMKSRSFDELKSSPTNKDGPTT